ncbi:MAG: AI-2E family transporter [bacterium]|nr:AI-2E family transporter [bacterium]
MTEEREDRVESVYDKLLRHLYINRKPLFWVVCIGIFIWLSLAIREITTLLLTAYAIAVLLDPLLLWLEKRRVSRSFAIIFFGLVLLLFFILLVIVAIPLIVSEYAHLISVLPAFLQIASERVGVFASKSLGISVGDALQQLNAEVKNHINALGVEQLKTVATTVLETVLKGYSLTLTIFNLTFLPFFVFYIARDLKTIHKVVGGFIPTGIRRRVQLVALEILSHVYGFFRGQFTVSFIMAGFYVVGLSLIGLPYAFVVGLLAGLLNIVPYLGVAIGILLSLIITLVTEPTWLQLGMLIGVFIAVHAVESTLLTPKIVGDSVGIHPLGVMLALIVGGQLMGLFGLVIAIPAAAAARVLFLHMRQVVEAEAVLHE